MGRLFVLLACIAAGLALAAARLSLPASRPATAPAVVFSAERATTDVRAVSLRPRPTGSPEARRVRDHLLRRLQALGVAAEVQRATALSARGLGDARRGALVGGEVENVIGVLRGRDPALPAVLLMAHYDSVPSSPGAADDAVGVATLLETARALRAGPPLQRDVVLLFTDGEETGLFGARAFFAEHPLGRRVGTVLNLEARGSSGPALMFETGRRNAGLIEVLAATAPGASANSLSSWVYEQLPNDTDFTIPRERGLAGLNFAITADQQDYHSPSATPANLSQASLQHMGDQALAVAAALARSATDAPRTADAVYFDVLGTGLVRYPPWLGWLPVGSAAGLLVVAVARARRRGLARWPDIGRGAAGLLFLAVVGVMVIQLARQLLGSETGLTGLRPILVQFALYEAAVVLIAAGVTLFTTAALVRGARLAWAVPLGLGVLETATGGVQTGVLGLAGVGAVLALAAFRPRPADPISLYAGAVSVLAVGAAALQAFAPVAAFVLGWPALLAALSLVLAVSGRRPFTGAGGVAATVVGLALFAWLAAFGHLVLVSLGAELPQAVVPVVVLAALALAPVLLPAAERWPAKPAAILLLLAGLGLFGVVAVRHPWSPRSPRASQAIYVADPARQRFLRVHGLDRLDPWSRGVLAADGGTLRRGDLPEIFFQDASYAAARPVRSIPVPMRFQTAPDGTARLTVGPWIGRDLRLTLQADVAVSSVTVQGRPARLLGAPGQASRLRWTGSGPVTVAFRPSRPGAISVTAAVVQDGWPADGRPLPPRPRDVGAWGQSDATVTVTRAAAHF